MTNFTYNQIIEYEDCTRDLNFEAARRWAAENWWTASVLFFEEWSEANG